jgi:hypothetical protein
MKKTNSVTVDKKYLPAIEQLTAQQCKSGENIQKRSKRTSAEINRQGLIAEFAICQHFAIDPLRHVTRNGSDGGVDLVLPGSDKTLQIKYTPVKNGMLIAGNNQPITADVVIMTERCGGMLDVRVVGYTTREEFYKRAKRKRFRANLPLDYYVPGATLWPIRDIWGVL